MKSNAATESRFPYERILAFAVTSLLTIAMVAKPTVGFPQATGGIVAKVIVKRIVVKDDTNTGVASEIKLMAPDDSRSHFAQIDGSGEVAPNQACTTKDRIIAIPTSTQYVVLGLPPYCQSEIRLKATYIQTAQLIFKAGEDADNRGAHGLAAMLWSEAYSRAFYINDDLSKQARLKSFSALGKYLNLEKPTAYDALQRKNVLSYEAVQALKDFQYKNKLPVTGMFDYSTAESMAGKPVGPFIVDSYKGFRPK